MNKYISTLIITSFLLTICIGAVFLMLPFSTTHGYINPEDALFTSASAVTVTGLSTVDTCTYFTTFGQIVILILIQIGGLGFMTFSTFTILVMGKSFTIKDKAYIENDFTAGNYKNVKDLAKEIILATFIIEWIGALLLYIQFKELKGMHRVFAAFFHAISAFCNAGFSIFSNGLENYKQHWGINITIMLLIIFGGIGFLVIDETVLYFRRKIKRVSRFSLHSKLVFVITATLILGGALLILLEELFNPGNNLSLPVKILSALFHSVSARTAGFNTINMGIFSSASAFILMALMFIGASPGSTGGGIKTTSAGIILGYFRAKFRGRENVDIFYRNISPKTIEKAFIVAIISFSLISFFSFLLITFEPEKNAIQLIFETFSAFGTVGLSLGVTANLSWVSKIILSITMFIGRVGPLTVLIAMSKKESRAVIKYPEDQIMIG